MARIELSNIGGGGGTTLSLTTTGTSGAATLAGSVLNIPVYQGQLTLTTTGTSGAATLSGDVLNIPQYSGGGTPAGSAGQVQFNSTPAGSFAASADLAWDNTATQLNIGTPLTPTGTLNVRGGGTLTTVNLRLTNSGNTELFKVLDNGNTNIGTGFSWDNANSRLGLRIASQANTTLAISSNGDGAGNYILRGYDLSGVERFFVNANAEMRLIGDADAGTAGDNSLFRITSTFNPTSGNRLHYGFWFIQTINQTGGATGITRGVYVNPTLTSAFDWRSIEWTNNTGYGLYGAGTANNYLAGNTAIGTITPSARLHVRGANTSSGTNALLVQNSNPDDIYKIENNGKISYLATNTAAGTTGAQTINRPSGTVNFAAGATALVVTNSLCTTASLVFAEVRTNDATAQIKNVVPAAGSFTINLGAAATAETSVGFFIIN